jgi:Na+-transporting NADH:ubiquinone oxidoreductase subunit NqrC
MKYAIGTLATLFVISLILNVGLISGYVRIASPAQHQEMAYTDSQRALMAALVEDVR